MPHVAGHIEEEGFAPVDFGVLPGDDQGFAPVDFGIAPPQQRFVTENNSTVNMPGDASGSFASRESKELIEGREGFFGNTSIQELLNIPGGFAELADIKKIAGLGPELFVTTATGLARERVVLGAEKRAPTPEDITEIQGLAIEAVIELSRGDFRSGVTKLVDTIGKARRIAPAGLGAIRPFNDVANLIIQKNPEKAQRFSDKMLEVQAANEDLLIRNGLMFGPDDEPTLMGNLISQAGQQILPIAASIYFKTPSIAAVLFGLSQQVSGFQEAEEAGKEPFAAATIGDVQGIIEGGLSMFELGKLARIINSKSVSITGKIIAGMVAEGIEEGTQEALNAGVRNITGVVDMSPDEVLNTVFQAVFYGSLAGGGITGAIGTVQRFVGDTAVPESEIERFARVMLGVAEDTAVEVTEQAIDDADVELQIGRDAASDQPVTKAAKATKKQQERVVEIIRKMNEGEEIDVRAELDEALPEIRIQREKARFEEGRRADTRRVTKQAVRDEIVQLQAEVQIAEQQGNEEEAVRLSERIDEIQQVSFTDVNLREAVEELEAEGIFVRADEAFDRAVTAVEDVLRPLRAGVRVGRTLQKGEGNALRKSLTNIVKSLGKKPKDGDALIDPKDEVRLQRKVDAVNTVVNAERIRGEILSLARKAAFRKFIRERRDAINKTILDIAGEKIGKLDPDSQNAVDSMNKMQTGMKKARTAKNFPPVKERTDEEKDRAAKEIEVQTVDFNAKQSQRIQDDMGQGIPAEGVMLQVRYLDILNEKAKATPNAVASFEDDLNAFIETGKGIATAADAVDQRAMDKAIAQLKANKTKDSRADVEDAAIIKIDKGVDFFLRTQETNVRALGLKDTVFDLFKEEVAWRSNTQIEREKIRVLAGEVSSDGPKYMKELSDKKSLVIDVPREGHTKELGGKQSKRLKMTRGQLVYAKMLLMEGSIAEQIRDPDGSMAWTDELIDMIDQRLTDDDRAFINGLFDIYRESYERFNESYRAIYNRDLTRVEFYSHIAREGKDGVEKSAHTETVFIDIVNSQGTEGSLIFPPREPSESKTRVNASSEIRIVNVVEVFDSYTYDVEHFNALGKKLNLQDKVLRDEQFIKKMHEILRPSGFDNFIEHTKIIARSNQVSREIDRSLRDLFEFFRGNFFTATLTANPKIGLGQTATSLAAMSEMPKANFIAGATDYIANFKKANSVLDTHPTFSSRELNFNPEIDQVGGFDGIIKLLNLPSRKGDGFGARVSGHAIVKYLTEEKGVSQKDAVDRAAEFVERSQQSTLLTQRTLAQKSDNPLYRTLTMFSSSPVAMLNVSTQSIIEYRQSDTSTPKKKAAARKKLKKTLAIQNLYIPVLYSVITGRSVATLTAGSLAGAPIIGGILQTSAEIFLNLWREEDEKVFTDGVLGEVALFKAVDDILETARKMAKDDLTIIEYLEASIPIIEALRGLPVGNSIDMFKGAMELFDTDDSIDASLQMLNYGDAARKRTIDRFDAITGAESKSDTISSTGAFR